MANTVAQFTKPVSVDGRAPVAQTPAYRHQAMPGTLFLPTIQTLYDNFQQGLRLSRDKPCLGQRSPSGEYQFQTYAQVAERFTHFGSGLVKLMSSVGRASESTGAHVGIYAINRPEWVICEQACNSYSMVTVALYDTLVSHSLIIIHSIK